MAQKYGSPGVFSEENDVSFLSQGTVGTGAAVIGRTAKGPAFVPVTVDGFDGFASVFGDVDTSMQMPYAAKNYLKNSNVLNVVRVLGHDDGTSTTNGYFVDQISGITDADVGQVLAIVHHTGSKESLSVVGVALDANKFVVKLTGSAGVLFATTASFAPTSPDYIQKVMNTDPTKYDVYGHYLYEMYKWAVPSASASWGLTEITGSTTDYRKNFTGASTPWIKSQPVGGQEFNLFRFHTLGHGNSANDDVKVEIANVKSSPSPLSTPYGTFDVIVRNFFDTDQRVETTETFVGCTLDPDSPNYILRVIGDHQEVFDTTQRKFVGSGDHENNSRFVRVELDTTVDAPDESLPWGHRGYAKESFATGSNISVVPDLRLTPNQIDRVGNIDTNICWGISFVSGSVEERMKADPITAVLGADADFSLSFLSASYRNGKQVWNYVPTLADSLKYAGVYASSSMHKFVMPFQGGFDGFDARVSDPTYITNSADDTDIGVVSLKRAIDTISNPDTVDMNIVAIPAVHNIKVTDNARQMVNNRKDTLYVMDVTGSSVAEAVDLLKSREIDDNYTSCYYPDLKMKDKKSVKIVRVAPSVAVLGALAFSDRVGHPWFAPAGHNRGGLNQFDVFDVADRLNVDDRNLLYDNRINPIATFPDEGIVIYGQKTLQVKASALDRVNVRRLMIYGKKVVAKAARGLLFESNNAATWQKFTKKVNPIFEQIRQDQGVERFKIVMDSTTNTAELIDKNIMTGKIFLQPTKSAEFVAVTFTITNAGVSFGE
jgi:phage tail sheath protein FI